MKTKTVIYWIATILLSIIFLYSAQMYIFNTEMIQGFFEQFNYPTYIVWPLAILKILGVIMILWRKSKWLTEWAYAGFFLIWYWHRQLTLTLVMVLVFRCTPFRFYSYRIS